MTGPALAVLLLACPAAAQTRAGAVDAAVIAAPGVGAAGAAPQAVSLNLTAPTLSMIGPVAPMSAAAAPALAAAAPAALAAPLPALAPLPAPAAPALVPIQKSMKETPTRGVSDMDEAAAIRLTRKLFGEDAGGADLSAYLRPDKPLAFGAKESAAYKAARSPKDKAAAAAGLLASAGVEATLEGGRVRVTPVQGGTPLNALAWDLKRAHGAAVFYDPERLGDSGVAAFNHRENALFLPHFGHGKSYAAVLHESHHSNYAARQTRGDLSPFHASLLARHGAVVPGVVYYSNYMSLEELTAHAKTLKHLLAEARRTGDVSFGKMYEVDAEVLKTQDVRRSASIALSRVLRQLDEGGGLEPLPADHWAQAELGPVGGGSWWVLRLPWCDLFVPVLDAPEPARKKGLARLFGRKEPTNAQRAARATADAVLAYLRATSGLLDALHSGLNADRPDLEALNTLADRLSLAGPEAEKAFRIR